jgi:hypothetical protein
VPGRDVHVAGRLVVGPVGNVGVFEKRKLRDKVMLSNWQSRHNLGRLPNFCNIFTSYANELAYEGRRALEVPEQSSGLRTGL